MTDDRTAFDELIEEHQQVLGRLRKELASPIIAAVELLRGRLADGGKVLLCGNGGSAADAQHFAAELVGSFGGDGKALRAIALTVDTSVLTALGNDRGFEEVFSRQIEALGDSGDVLVAISTSGRSANVVRAVGEARRHGLAVVALTGPEQDGALSAADVLLAIPSPNTQRIQEMHALALHAVGELLIRPSA